MALQLTPPTKNVFYISIILGLLSIGAPPRTSTIHEARRSA